MHKPRTKKQPKIFAVFLLGIVLWTPWALANYATSDDFASRMAHLNGIAEVDSAKSGVGGMVMVGKTPCLLTCSHILEGRKEATVAFPKDVRAFGLAHARIFHGSSIGSFKAKVLFDFPAADFACLALPPSLPRQSREKLTQAAKDNVTFCPIGAKDCKQGYRHESDIDGSSVMLWMDHHSLIWSNTLSSRTINDDIITGFLKTATDVRSYARPGNSGSFFYQPGGFSGLISRTSAVGEALSYATPVSEMAKVISAKWFKTVVDNFPTGKWTHHGGSTFLEIQNRNPKTGLYERIVSQEGGNVEPAGGPVSPPGGPVSPPGGPVSPPGGPVSPPGEDSRSAKSLWTIQTKNLGKFGYLWNETSNPFFTQPERLWIDGREVSYLAVRDENNAHKVQRIAPSAAAYLWYQKFAPERLIEAHLMDQSRQKARTPSTHSLHTLSLFREIKDGTLRLLLQSQLKRTPSGELAFDLGSADSILTKNERDRISSVRIANDLSKIELLPRSHHAPPVVFHSYQNRRQSIIIYRPEKNGCPDSSSDERAEIVRSSDDLQKINSIYIELKDIDLILALEESNEGKVHKK